MIPIDDRGLTLGDGLFETILADRGRLVLWDEHLDRLARGCAVLGLAPPDPRRCLSGAAAALARAGLGDARAAVRLTWTAGSGGRGLDRPAAPVPRLAVSAAAAPRPATPVRLALSRVRRNPDAPTSRLKSLSYLDSVLARREAVATGADEALMLNTRGELACAAAANLFWLEGGALCTPALDCGALDGIMRAALIRVARESGWTVKEATAGAEALEGADAVFLSNSLIGLRAASHLQGRALPTDGRVERLAALLGGLA